MSALRSATITQAMICKIKTGMNGLKWRVLLQLRRIEGHSKAQSKLHFGIYFSHLTVVFQVKIDIIWTKTCNDLDL